MRHARTVRATPALLVIMALLFAACQPAAPVTPSPGPGDTPAPPPTTPAPGDTPAPPTPGETPGGTPYPDPIATPTLETALTEYPNYGQEVDCEAGTFNGRPYAGNLRRMSAPDAQTVVFELCNPDVAFLQKIAFIVFGINDADHLAAQGGAGDLLGTINGTGPYVLDEWRRGDSLIYSAFEDYWGDQPLVPNAVLRWATDSATRLNEIRAGTVHGITNVGPTDFQAVRDDPNLELATPPEGEVLNTFYVGMNHNFAPWDDVNVRRAVGLAIDKQRLIDNFYPEGSEAATHFTPCALEYACEGDPWPDFNPDEARRLIDEATGGAGIDTVINFRVVDRGYLPVPRDVAADIAAQLADVGIRAEIEEQESGTFIANSNAGQLRGLFLLGWGADYPEITNFMDYHFGPGCTSGFGECYPEIAEPLARGNSTADPEERRAAYEEANNAIRDLVPMVPVAHGGFALAYQQGVEGMQAASLSNEYLWAMGPPSGDQIVFMQNAEPISVYCADETDGESLRACQQSMEGLYRFEVNGSQVEPALATSCDPNEDATVWTCQLREGVTFHDGATFEAADVLLSFAVQWDYLHPLHTGNTGAFEYWPGLWGDFLNPPGPCGLPNTDPCPPPS